MIALATLALAAATSADPCVAPPSNSVGPPDPSAAELYRAVGDEARATGDLDSARVAYREALRHDPTPANARAWREVCAGATPNAAAQPAAERFAEGVARMKAGDRAGAIAAFEEARAAGEDPPAALLEGVCQFELGHFEAARALFSAARGDASVAPTASFFLGLIAMREGANDRATALLGEAATGDPRLAQNASTLTTLARRDGRFVVSALVEVGYDSNVELVPDGTATPGSSADGSTVAAAGVTGRLLGVSGPYARLSAQYRKQFVITSYDLGQGGGALGVRAVGRATDVGAEYGYDFVTLGGAPYLSAHRLLGFGRAWTGAWALAGTYAARIETFLNSTVVTPMGSAVPGEVIPNDRYSGVRQAGELRATRQLGAVVSLALGYRGERDATNKTPPLSYWEQGPIAAIYLQAGGLARLVLEARYSWRLYDETDPDLGVQRSDQYLDGYAAADLDLRYNWTVRVAAAARRAFSNVPDFRYTKIATTAGLVYTFGVL